MFPFLTVFIIFLLVVYAIRARNTHKRERIVAAFWEREEEAMHTPAKDLSQAPYVKVPVDNFPIGVCDEDDLMLMEEELLELSGKPLLNLNGMTNTDIRIEYGTSNFDTITAMGEDFDRLIMLLCDYAKGLLENDFMQEAVTVLEYGVSIGSDVSENYTLLGECYRSQEMYDKLARLTDTVEHSSLPLKESVIRELKES